MHFKYALGDRLLFKKTSTTETSEELMGTVTAIHHQITKSGSKTTYWINDGAWEVSDSDILGTVTVKRTAAPRVRKPKTEKVVEHKQTELNGLAGEVCQPQMTEAQQ